MADMTSSCRVMGFFSVAMLIALINPKTPEANTVLGQKAALYFTLMAISPTPDPTKIDERHAATRASGLGNGPNREGYVRLFGLATATTIAHGDHPTSGINGSRQQPETEADRAH